jgi:excinuclease ABC subunit A
MSLSHITVRGAREHNLKGVDIDAAARQSDRHHRAFGLGKSSLAFDTIYAEGQRRYVESLSAYARQFLEMMQKPDVEHIDGLSPAISIEQKTTSRNPRSTVATVTEIYDYMRLLWARVGVPYSPATGLPIAAQTVSQMVDRVMALPEGTRAYLLAPPCAVARANIARKSPSGRRRAIPACASMASCMPSRTRPRSTRSTSTTSRWWSTAWR